MVFARAKLPAAAGPYWHHAEERAGQGSAPDYRAFARVSHCLIVGQAGLSLAIAKKTDHDNPSLVSEHFTRSHRLLTAADYSRVFDDSRRLSDRYWTILVHQSAEVQPRLGLAIAKKRAKRAVDRNRLKRIVREAFRRRAHKLPGRELVVMNRDDAVKAGNATLQQSLDMLLERA